MPLTAQEAEILNLGILTYGFPPDGYNFINNSIVVHANMLALEISINSDLISGVPANVRNGLANIIYWGWAQNVGLQAVRVQRFLNSITNAMIASFSQLVGGPAIPSMQEIKNLKMPQFSGMSFISKVLMFLNPANFCVLDQQIARLRNQPGAGYNILDNLVFGGQETQIRISGTNQAVYNAWRHKCANISALYFNNSYRCADVERGFFQLIQTGNLNGARTILNNA